jgi:hypothetical protein
MGFLVDKVAGEVFCLSSMSIFSYLCIIPILMRIRLSPGDRIKEGSQPHHVPTIKIKSHYNAESTFL